MSALKGRDIIRAEYHSDVREMAASIIEWWKDNTDKDRDDLIEYIDESIDGCARVVHRVYLPLSGMLPRNSRAR